MNERPEINSLVRLVASPDWGEDWKRENGTIARVVNHLGHSSVGIVRLNNNPWPHDRIQARFNIRNLETLT
jgi:hypothetical protein